MRYMCAECGTEIEKPQDITEPKKFIFDNLFVAGSDVECPKCNEKTYKKYQVTYYDEIEAETEEKALEILKRQITSDVEYGDFSVWEIKETDNVN